MGRLDDAAKRKVVELREAGLSFRKIKAVLELENIKVSAQAIYLFLKEFQGRARKEDGAAGNSGSLSRVAASQQAAASSDGRGGPSSGTGSAGMREAQGREKDEDIRIVSVTSLAQGAQHAGVQGPRSGVGAGAMSAANYTRRRHAPSPANPVLVARKRLLDKALLHRARVRDSVPQSGQQMSLSVRRDPACFPGSEGRKLALPQTSSYDLTTARPPNIRSLHQGANPHRRWMHQRVGVPVRAPQQPPRVGIRLPDPSSSAGTTSQNPAPPARVQNASNQPSPPPQRSGLDPGVASGLQEQIQLLGSELRSLGLALRMMVDHQARLEREQAQQTQVQKQILGTLQDLASKFEPLRSTSAPALPASCSLASSAPFGQAASAQGAYAQCSQAQTRYNEIHDSGLESIEVFSLDQLSPPSMNGFQQCPTSGGPPFTHAQARAPAFAQAHTQTFAPQYTDSFPGMDKSSVDMPSTGADGSFQACSPPNQSSSLPVSPHEPELNIIKVENV
ncbi:atherin-like [Puntigrus tetrazona]|uniref:atherin-like n=1 Tax=Puntigrus tetrazona TaxID=1606681 RepID=UPI001C8968BE|nr:atherin-like [Puntigrus tetrazona]